MANYVLSCSSTADLTKEHLEERDIKYIYFHFHLTEKNTSTTSARPFPLRISMQQWKTGRYLNQSDQRI